MEREYRRAIAEGVAVSCEKYDPRLGKWLDIRACPCEGELAVHLRDVTQWHGMVDRLREQEVRLRRSREHVSRSLETRRVLAAAFEEPFYVNGFTITVSARFGYTILGKLARDAQRLMREAELALFEARSRDLPGWIAFTGAPCHCTAPDRRARDVGCISASVMHRLKNRRRRRTDATRAVRLRRCVIDGGLRCR